MKEENGPGMGRDSRRGGQTHCPRAEGHTVRTQSSKHPRYLCEFVQSA